MYWKLIICQIRKPTESKDNKFPLEAEILPFIVIDLPIYGSASNNELQKLTHRSTIVNSVETENLSRSAEVYRELKIELVGWKEGC